MTDKTYNGWTNYATWRVNLEIFDGLDAESLGCFSVYSTPELSDVAEYLKDYADEIVFMDVADGLASSYARSFMDEVNWHEIAGYFIATWNDMMQEYDTEEVTE